MAENKIKSVVVNIEDLILKEEFVKAFEEIVAFVNKIDSRNEKEMAVCKELCEKFIAKLEEKHDKNVGEIADKFESLKKDINTTLDAQVRKTDKKLENVKDGDDADEERITQSVLERIQLPEQKEIILDGPEQLRDKLESLEGDERLDKSAIKGLTEEFKRIEALAKTKGGFQGGVIGRNLIKDIDLSASLNGVTKTFNIPSSWNIISVALSSYPYGALRKNIDYIYTQTSITFTANIDAATQLAAGQQCILTVISG